jgi:hypothetical protein
MCKELSGQLKRRNLSSTVWPVGQQVLILKKTNHLGRKRKSDFSFVFLSSMSYASAKSDELTKATERLVGATLLHVSDGGGGGGGGYACMCRNPVFTVMLSNQWQGGDSAQVWHGTGFFS